MDVRTKNMNIMNAGKLLLTETDTDTADVENKKLRQEV